MDAQTYTGGSRSNHYSKRGGDFPHKVRFALQPDDILALVHFDEPVCLLHVEDYWHIGKDGQYLFHNDNHAIGVVHNTREEVDKHRGRCTVFRFQLQHGYRIHYLSYLKDMRPELYARFHLS